MTGSFPEREKKKGSSRNEVRTEKTQIRLELNCENELSRARHIVASWEIEKETEMETEMKKVVNITKLGGGGGAVKFLLVLVVSN